MSVFKRISHNKLTLWTRLKLLFVKSFSVWEPVDNYKTYVAKFKKLHGTTYVVAEGFIIGDYSKGKIK